MLAGCIHTHTQTHTHKYTEQALATDTNVTVGPSSPPSPPLYREQIEQKRGRGEGYNRVEFACHTQSMIIVCVYMFMSLRGAF